MTDKWRKIETRVLYVVAFTMVGIVLATYVLPSLKFPPVDKRIELAMVR